MTSLTHRTTGIVMGVALYGLSVGLLLKSGDFPSYVESIKNAQLAAPLMFTAKSVMAFPLVYHYINGIRHLVHTCSLCYDLLQMCRGTLGKDLK